MFYLRILLTMFVFLGRNTLGVDIPVPSPEDMAKSATVILVGRFTEPTRKVFTVDTVIKAPQDLGKTVTVVSPFPEFSFPFNQFLQDLRTRETILVGRWDNERKVAVLAFGSCSFWPQGAPKGLLPTENRSELEIFIRRYIKDSPQHTPKGQ